MKTLNKLAVGAALLGAITTAQAEQMVFGAVVEPIMSLEVEGRILPADALLTGTNTNATGIAPAASSSVVGVFRVTTNVVKWNVKMTLENSGVLKNWSGNTLTTDAAATAGQLGDFTTPGTTNALYISTTSLDGGLVDAIADIPVTVIHDGSAVPVTIVKYQDAVPNTSKLTDVFDFASAPAYIYNVVKNSLAFEVKTVLEGTKVTALAGTYTETLNLSLYGSY